MYWLVWRYMHSLQLTWLFVFGIGFDKVLSNKRSITNVILVTDIHKLSVIIMKDVSSRLDGYNLIVSFIRKHIHIMISLIISFFFYICCISFNAFISLGRINRHWPMICPSTDLKLIYATIYGISILLISWKTCASVSYLLEFKTTSRANKLRELFHYESQWLGFKYMYLLISVCFIDCL